LSAIVFVVEVVYKRHSAPHSLTVTRCLYWLHTCFFVEYKQQSARVAVYTNSCQHISY
jgi:hypothetical protein